MNIEKERVKEDLKINRFGLEKESSKQPSLYFYYSSELSDLRFKREKLETKLSYSMAEKELKIRENPPNNLKLTESLVKALLEKDEVIHDLKNQIVEIKKDIYTLDSVVSSLEQKNSQLKVLKDLYLSNYFSVDDYVKEKTDEGSNKARNKLNKEK